ncbi:MAG: hypothetical protein IIX14_02565, partial [Clostridia bacterium]|nr:hypothetical protein [Clostridia bacterium]
MTTTIILLSFDYIKNPSQIYKSVRGLLWDKLILMHYTVGTVKTEKIFCRRFMINAKMLSKLRSWVLEDEGLLT